MNAGVTEVTGAVADVTDAIGGVVGETVVIRAVIVVKEDVRVKGGVEVASVEVEVIGVVNAVAGVWEVKGDVVDEIIGVVEAIGEGVVESLEVVKEDVVVDRCSDVGIHVG